MEGNAPTRTPAPVQGGRGEPLGPAAFEEITCGIDGSRAGFEAAEQAIALAGTDAKLHFVCVAYTIGEARATAIANINAERAREAVDEAVRMAHEKGLSASSELVRTTDIDSTLLGHAGPHDLLVVGSHGHSRAGGIFLGSTATAAVHGARSAILVARREPYGAPPFPGRILVATDGSQTSEACCEAAGRIARRNGPKTQLIVLHVNRDGAEARRGVSEHVVRITELAGFEPVVIEQPGHVHRTICDVAEQQRVALVLLGSRQLGGALALASVSERVAHTAPSSVLVVRPDADERS